MVHKKTKRQYLNELLKYYKRHPREFEKDMRELHNE